MSANTLFPAVFAALICAGLASPVAAHPFHFSFAQGEFNEESGRLEVSLRLEPHDLEAALRQQASKPVKLEEEETEKLMEAYLKQSLQFHTTNGKQAAIKWIGSEVKVKTVWLYFEVSLPQGLEGVKVTNGLLLEHLGDQVNVMSLKQGQQAATMQFSAKTSTQTVKLAEKASEE